MAKVRSRYPTKVELEEDMQIDATSASGRPNSPQSLYQGPRDEARATGLRPSSSPWPAFSRPLLFPCAASGARPCLPSAFCTRLDGGGKGDARAERRRRERLDAPDL